MDDIRIGDTVRFIPPSYIELVKADYHYRMLWHESEGQNDKEVMLGGEYQILDIMDNFAKLILQNDRSYKPLDWLIRSEKVNQCPFRIGDRVSFRPKCNKNDIAYLTRFRNCNLSDNQFVVTYVLNKYFIFIEHKIDNIGAFPYRWIDFSKEEI